MITKHCMKLVRGGWLSGSVLSRRLKITKFENKISYYYDEDSSSLFSFNCMIVFHLEPSCFVRYCSSQLKKRYRSLDLTFVLPFGGTILTFPNIYTWLALVKVHSLPIKGFKAEWSRKSRPLEEADELVMCQKNE